MRHGRDNSTFSRSLNLNLSRSVLNADANCVCTVHVCTRSVIRFKIVSVILYYRYRLRSIILTPVDRPRDINSRVLFASHLYACYHLADVYYGGAREKKKQPLSSISICRARSLVVCLCSILFVKIFSTAQRCCSVVFFFHHRTRLI